MGKYFDPKTIISIENSAKGIFVPKEIINCPILNLSEKYILSFLLPYVQENGTVTGVSWRKIRELTKASGRNTLFILLSLQEKGFIQITHVPYNKKYSMKKSIYKFLYHPYYDYLLKQREKEEIKQKMAEVMKNEKI